MPEQTEAPRQPDASQTTPPQGAAALSFATIGDRFIAQVVDGLVGFGVFFFVGMTLAPRFGGATQSGFNLSGWPAAVVIAIVSAVMLAYLVLAEGFLGATLGKLAAGIRVQTPGGERIGVRRALIRNLMRIIDGIGVYLVGAIAILTTQRKQRLGDLAARSVVIRHESSRAARVTALVAAVILAIAGVAGGFLLRPAGGSVAEKAPAGQPRFAAAVVTDDTERKVERTVFTPDTEKIYVTFTLADVPPDTPAKFVWFAENVQGVPANEKIGEHEKPMGGPKSEGNAFLTRPTKGWWVGAYRVELYLAGQLAHTARFRVEALAAAQTPAGPPRFATVVVTDDKEGTVEKTVLPPDTAKIYVLYTLTDALPAGTPVKAVWIAENVQGVPANNKIDEYEFKPGGPIDRGNFFLSPPSGGWPVGTYRVELHLAGELAHTARFRVEPR